MMVIRLALLSMCVALAKAQTPIAVGQVCYRFCEDGSKEAVNSREACVAGSTCEKPLGAPEVGFDSCSTPQVCTADQAALLADAKALWKAGGLANGDYSYTRQRSCECMPPDSDPFAVVVTAGAVTSVTLKSSGKDYPLDGAETVDEMFKKIEDTLAASKNVDVTYDSTWGHPTRVTLDVEATWVDGGEVFSVSDFKSVSGPAAPACVLPGTDTVCESGRYNDGCNTCTCDTMGAVCTEMACVQQGTPKCLESLEGGTGTGTGTVSSTTGTSISNQGSKNVEDPDISVAGSDRPLSLWAVTQAVVATAALFKIVV